MSVMALVMAASGNNAVTGLAWVQRLTDANRSWSAVASSADGVNLVAAFTSGYIYTSSDSGATWTERTSAGNRYWQCLACSANGSVIIAGSDGNFWLSTNSGTSWTEKSIPGQSTSNWKTVACSADGTKIALGANNNSVFISSDTGSTWSPASFVNGRASINMSSDGTKIVCVGYTTVSVSTNSGSSFTNRTTPSTGDGFAVYSGDGSTLYHCAGGTNVYKSTNDGASWVALSLLGASGLTDIACSFDGTKVFICARNNLYINYSPFAFVYSSGEYIRISNDSGATWVEQSFAGYRGWSGIACSSDGSKLIACDNPGYIYTSA
jgi:photosystem II stability/assembly factor-like uncharacterized protein